MTEHQHTKFCHCGTCDEAIAAGEKLAAELIAANCSIWAFQVASIVVLHASEIMNARAGSPDIGDNYRDRIHDALTEELIERFVRDPDRVLRAVSERRAKLGLN